jgi:hypothetical protein
MIMKNYTLVFRVMTKSNLTDRYKQTGDRHNKFNQNTTTRSSSNCDSSITQKCHSSGLEINSKRTLPATSTKTQQIQQQEKPYLEKDQTIDVS